MLRCLALQGVLVDDPDDEDGGLTMGDVFIDDEGRLIFKSRTAQREEKAAAAPEGSRPAIEETGTPEASA